MTAIARNTDPETSHEAAATVRVRTSQLAVYALLCHGPATDEQLAERADQMGVVMSPSGLRSRRCELVRMGWVCDTGRREITASGRRSIVWEITD